MVEVKNKIVSEYRKGATVPSLAKKFKVSMRTAYRYTQHLRKSK